MEHFLYALLGWAAGVFSNLILEWNREKRQVGSLRKALQFEMKQYRNRMASIVYFLSVRSGALTADAVDWLIAEFEVFDAPDFKPDVLDALKEMKKHPETANAVSVSLAATAGQRSPGLKKYPAPALDAAVASVALFDPAEQTNILEARTLIANYEATVDEAWRFLEMTYDSSLTPENRQKVEANLELAYRRAVHVCRRIALYAGRLSERVHVGR